jgi:hypothetical protein
VARSGQDRAKAAFQVSTVFSIRRLLPESVPLLTVVGILVNDSDVTVLESGVEGG